MPHVEFGPLENHVSVRNEVLIELALYMLVLLAVLIGQCEGSQDVILLVSHRIDESIDLRFLHLLREVRGHPEALEPSDPLRPLLRASESKGLQWCNME